ncbi:hypothetical protein Asppvi_005801 [Aspergillus pseudoviridinutans]|uniref:H-type lectin domain-containing protein n=1 Tax=Aspergillus pseudoviridinutans TaxID=1517512 RepID=A0A9P3EVB8_9EURO|nr:uncharacterized protein Asppvi_005801 [Aspergillus pseudoviridinutans]GIJ86903.1 hypothetical protein Asppvi_005801 [Aspergillus pseudoviridinutans]
MSVSYQARQQIPSEHCALIRQGKYLLEIDNHPNLTPINKEGRLNVGNFSGNAFILAQIGEEGRKIGVLNDCLRFEREGEAISGHRLIVNAPVSVRDHNNAVSNRPGVFHDNDDDDDDDDDDTDNDDANSNKPNGSNLNPKLNSQPPPSNSNLVGRVEELERQLRRLSIPVPDNSLAHRVQELEGQLKRLSIPVPDNGLPQRVQGLEDQLRRFSPLVPDNNLMGRVSTLESQIRSAARSDSLSVVDAGSYTTPYLPGQRREYRINFAKRFQRPPSVVTSISMADVDRGANLRLRVRAQNVDSNGFTLFVEAWADTRLYQCTVSWVALSG